MAHPPSKQNKNCFASLIARQICCPWKLSGTVISVQLPLLTFILPDAMRKADCLVRLTLQHYILGLGDEITLVVLLFIGAINFLLFFFRSFILDLSNAFEV